MIDFSRIFPHLQIVGRQLNQREFFQHAEKTLRLNGIEDKESILIVSKVLASYYNSHNRFYHTTQHIVDVFRFAYRYFSKEGRLTLEPSEQLAILFHDAVFNIAYDDNEERSVDLMVAVMRSFSIPLNEYSWASRCIRETANHLSEVKDASTHAVLDLDLAGFAEPYSFFKKASSQVLAEYSAKPKDRAAFLKKLLKKERLYYKLTFLEDKARENIEKYIKEVAK